MSRLLFLSMVCLVSGTPWRFDDNSITTTDSDAAYIELQTDPNKRYIPLQEIGIEVKQSQAFIFQVRAMREANILLQADAGDTTQKVYEITLGGWANTRSVLRKAVLTGRIMVDHRHHPLNRTEFRCFWISWNSGRVSVGSGEIVGINAFMTYRDPVPHPVNYISVSTDWGVTGIWKFASPSRMIGLWTNPELDLQFQSLSYRGYSVEDTGHFSFWVKATNDVNVVLTSNTLSYTNMYWVSLGVYRNTMSFIRKGRMGPDLAHALHSPLTPNHYLPFWITWKGGVVAVGEGTEVGKRQFMMWTDRSPIDVTEVYVSTGRGSTGHWLIYLNGDQVTRRLPLREDSITLNA